MCNDYDIILVAYEEEKENKLKKVLQELKNIYNKDEVLKIAIVIGSEGGIDKEEVEELKNINNAKVITLGDRILRTETVALNIISIIMYEFEG